MNHIDKLLATHVIPHTDVRGHGIIAQREMARRDAIEAEVARIGLRRRSFGLCDIGRSLLACGAATFVAHVATLMGGGV